MRSVSLDNHSIDHGVAALFHAIDIGAAEDSAINLDPVVGDQSGFGFSR